MFNKNIMMSTEMYIYPFEKLRVWQESKLLIKDVYSITSGFPKSEMYGLVDQLRRASISVSSNIAEGSTRTSRRDQARFSTIAFGSLMEVVNQLIIAVDLGFMKKEKYLETNERLSLLSNQINKLKRSQLNSTQKFE